MIVAVVVGAAISSDTQTTTHDANTFAILNVDLVVTPTLQKECRESVCYTSRSHLCVAQYVTVVVFVLCIGGRTTEASPLNLACGMLWGNRKHGFSELSDATSLAPSEIRPTFLYSII